MQCTVVAVFPNASESGSSYSCIMASCSSLIHFKDGIFFLWMSCCLFLKLVPSHHDPLIPPFVAHSSIFPYSWSRYFAFTGLEHFGDGSTMSFINFLLVPVGWTNSVFKCSFHGDSNFVNNFWCLDHLVTVWGRHCHFCWLSSVWLAADMVVCSFMYQEMFFVNWLRCMCNRWRFWGDTLVSHAVPLIYCCSKDLIGLDNFWGFCLPDITLSNCLTICTFIHWCSELFGVSFIVSSIHFELVMI